MEKSGKNPWKLWRWPGKSRWLLPPDFLLFLHFIRLGIWNSKCCNYRL